MWSMSSFPVSRRSAIKLLGLGVGASTLPLSGCSKLFDRFLGKTSIESVSPIDRGFRGEVAPRRYSGDQPDRTHKILWNKSGFLAGHGGKLPEPTEHVPLVVIGGGMSGLMTAYLLRDHRPVILERAERFGGNSRGESWNGADYALGAAYFIEPPKKSPAWKLLEELDVHSMYRPHDEADPVIWKGKRYPDFWEGTTDPANAAQFKKIFTHFRDVYHGRNGWFFPEVPVTNEALRAITEALDRITFKRHMEKVAGEKLHPHIETAMEHYCWSSFGGSFGEISAASGLNFYAGDFGKVVVTPGGNGAVAERILERLSRAVPRSNLRTESIVFDVSVRGDGVAVSYEQADGSLKSIHAKAAVMACPKFAAAKILAGIEPERAAAIRKLKYHSYLVANVLLRGNIVDDFYDLYLIGDGQVDPKDIRGSALKQKVTDVVNGTYAKIQPDRAILTLYRALPFEGSRGMIFDAGSYDRYRSEFEAQLGEILPLVNRTKADVVDVRVTRWGHPLPVASAGLIADGTVDAIRRPFRERVFFVEQDNWMLPSFESVTTESLHWAPHIDRRLRA